MSGFPKPCGRLDWHDEHEWTRPAHLGDNERTYSCTGRILSEGGWWLDWNPTHVAADDRREDELDRQIRDGLAEWGGAA